MDGRRVGWLAVATLLGTARFWRSALEARVDMLFATAVTAALASAYVWYRQAGDRAPTGVYLAMAAAVLTKGPAGAVLPLLTIVGFLALQRDVRALRRFAAVRPALGALLLVVGWYAAAAWRGGWDFVAVQVLRENVDRFAGAGIFDRDRWHDVGMLLGAFVVQLFPWNTALLLHGVEHARAADADARFLHAWWAGMLALLVVSAGTRPVYLLPLFPAVALLAARTLAARVPARRTRRLGVLCAALAAGTLAIRWRAATGDPLLAFARDVAARVPLGASVGATGRVSENDHIVLAYRLDRSLPRVARSGPRPRHLLATGTEAAGVIAGCRPVASAPPGANLVLLSCTDGDGAPARRAPLVGPLGEQEQDAARSPVHDVQRDVPDGRRLRRDVGADGLRRLEHQRRADAVEVHAPPVAFELRRRTAEHALRESVPHLAADRQVDRHGALAVRPEPAPAEVQLPQRVRVDVRDRAPGADDDRDRRGGGFGIGRLRATRHAGCEEQQRRESPG
jgi:hypothetical protein